MVLNKYKNQKSLNLEYIVQQTKMQPIYFLSIIGYINIAWIKRVHCLIVEKWYNSAVSKQLYNIA